MQNFYCALETGLFASDFFISFLILIFFFLNFPPHFQCKMLYVHSMLMTNVFRCVINMLKPSVCVWVCMCVCVRVSVRACVCVCACVRARAYMCMRARECVADTFFGETKHCTTPWKKKLNDNQSLHRTILWLNGVTMTYFKTDDTLVDRLTDWLADRLTNWLNGWLTDSLTDWLPGWLTQ